MDKTETVKSFRRQKTMPGIPIFEKRTTSKSKTNLRDRKQRQLNQLLQT